MARLVRRSRQGYRAPRGALRTVIPFGPQHPVLPEPIHLDLVIEDEKVVEAIPKIGFIHRGFEKLVEKMDFNELVYVADRICGICAFIHSMAYCMGVETLLKWKFPRAPCTCERSGRSLRVFPVTSSGSGSWRTRSVSRASSCRASASGSRSSTFWKK